MSAVPTPPPHASRLELIFSELESLPTLSNVAVRLLELTADTDSDSQEIIQLVSSDPSLAARVLSLCRCHPEGRAANVTTVDRAVLMLGFDAVRAAVLAVQVFEAIEGLRSPSGETVTSDPIFDREAFWMHALAVAVVSERLARHGPLVQEVTPGEAFMAGLIHDIGQLALHVLLPESFDRICRLAETHAASLDHACRQTIGIDSHTAGKRLAEHWRLPESLVEVIWLNGQAFDALPESSNRSLISIVTLADAYVRSRYISTNAHWSRFENLQALCTPIGINGEQLDEIAANLHATVTNRAEALGLTVAQDPTILLRSISRANASLARSNVGMRQREETAKRHGLALEAIRSFQADLPSRVGFMEVLARLVASASRSLDVVVAAALFPAEKGRSLRFVRFARDGRSRGGRFVEVPDGAIAFGHAVMECAGEDTVSTRVPWLVDMIDDDPELALLRPLGIEGLANGGVILLVKAAAPIERDDAMVSLLGCWRCALDAGLEHDAAAQVAEELAEANRRVVDLHERVARNETMATLGEVAAGAAHEMNNPLAIISGRSQILAKRLSDPQLNRMAVDIFAESHRLSDMISALRSFAEPVMPKRKPSNLADLVVRVVQKYGHDKRRQPQVNTVLTEQLPRVVIDADLIGVALGELVRNAVESKGSRHIELRVQIEPLDDRLRIEVRDDGEGLSPHALKHAFDPFFSEHSAGRQPGLGLARARLFAEAHGGQVTLVNGPSGGAIATLWLSDWREQGNSTETRSAA